MTNRGFLVFVLVMLGAGWGLTMPLTKIAVSEGYRHFGVIFWQFTIGAIVLGALSIWRGKTLPLGWPQLRLYAIIAFLGTIFPNSASIEAARHLPAGIIAILLSLMPMFSLPIALALRNDRLSVARVLGLVFGFVGVLVLIAPDASLPNKAMIAFIPLALVSPFFYALEGNVVGKWGTFGCDPIQVLLGASIIGAIFTIPFAIYFDHWIDPRPPWRAPDGAVVAGSLIHAAAYVSYVWLVGRAGSVFAAQVSYLVTAFGIFWAMIILSESYSNWIWLSLMFIFAGLFLVQPRRAQTSLEARTPVGEDTA